MAYKRKEVIFDEREDKILIFYKMQTIGHIDKNELVFISNNKILYSFPLLQISTKLIELERERDSLINKNK